MPEPASPSITVVKVAHNTATAQEAQDLLLQSKPNGVRLMIFVEGKFDCRKLAVVRNIAANYPIEPIVLHNTAMLAATSGATPVYYRDGFELFCLERAVQDPKLERLLLLRGSSMPSDEDVRRFEETSKLTPIETHGIGEQQSILLNSRFSATREGIFLAAEMYRSGAVLSLAEESISHVLRVAIEAFSRKEGAAAGEKLPEPRRNWRMLPKCVKSALAWASRPPGLRR